MYEHNDADTEPGRKKLREEDSGQVEKQLLQLIEWAHMINVADSDMIEEGRLDAIGARVKREYDIDENSRNDWRLKAEKGLSRAKLKSDAKTYPFENAANVKFPLLTTAALQFAARAYPAIVDGQRIVKCQVVGDDESGEKRSKAERISTHMSYQLSTQMVEWEEDTDYLLHQLPIVGCAFRKVWYDPTLKRNRSEMISALDLVVNNNTRSLENTPRITQEFKLYPHEIDERVESGAFLDVEIGRPSTGADDDDEPHEFLEQHRYLDLDEDGYREPWIVTVHKETQKVVRIVANYDPMALAINEETNRIERIERYNTFVKYSFFRDPEGGFYDLGFGELLEQMSSIIDSTINQMLDAGHLQNAGGGFIGSGIQLKKQQLRFRPGKYHTVDMAGGNIRDSIVNINHPGPSAVLFQLLGMMVESGREIANVKDILSGEQNSNAPATTTIALIEQGMKVYTSIYKRVYRSLKREYQLLFDLNAKHLPEQQYLMILDDRAAVYRADYDTEGMDLAPVADPNVVTDMQKLSRAQAYFEVSQHPGVDGDEAMRRYFEAIGAPEIDKLLPKQEEPQGPTPEQDLAMRDAAAEVAGKDAKAKEAEAKAEKTMVETALLKKEVEDSDAKEFMKDFEAGLGDVMADDEDEAEQMAARFNQSALNPPVTGGNNPGLQEAIKNIAAALAAKRDANGNAGSEPRVLQ